MEINKKDLKKISRSFRSIASRTINADYQEFDSILKMFIDYIASEQIIVDYINGIDVKINDIVEEVNNALNSMRGWLNTGNTIDEEIVKTYAILKYIVDNKMSVLNVCMPYSASNKFNDKVRGFGNRVILPFVNHINDYLMEISIDMGFDENEKYIITMHGGQFNLAKDSSVINASQNNGIDANQLNGLMADVLKHIQQGSEADKEIVIDSLEVIKSELSSDTPKKGFLKTAITGLQAVKGTAEFAAAVTALIQFAQPFI